jgi:hypothetical protein
MSRRSAVSAAGAAASLLVVHRVLGADRAAPKPQVLQQGDRFVLDTDPKAARWASEALLAEFSGHEPAAEPEEPTTSGTRQSTDAALDVQG